MQQLMSKAKEITSQFKQSHFLGHQAPHTAKHSRNESMQNLQSRKKSNEKKDPRSFNSSRQFSPFLNYQNIKSLMSRKQSVLTEQSDLSFSFDFYSA